MASVRDLLRSFCLLVFVACVTGQALTGVVYELSDLKSCKRVPNLPPCSITRANYVPDYASKQFLKLMEKIYRLARDVSRLDSRPQCKKAYEQFLCAQYFPKCRKGQDPRYPNLNINRRIIHDPDISKKCSNVIASCNELVSKKFVGDRYFLCDHVDNYPREGWEIGRCVTYDEESRCRTTGSDELKLPAWLRDQHDQEVQQFMNLTTFRVNHTLPVWCRIRLENFLCRHPICKDGKLLTNYTRQTCSNELECARFVPGEINVDAICLTFPSTSSYSLANMMLILITIFIFSACVL